MAVCIAIVGKENAPKFVICSDKESEIEFHYKVHTSLDIIEERLSGDFLELYLGLLYATEEHKIYGFVTNTNVKIIVVVDANHNALRDNDIRTMFRKLHAAYTDVVCNPFYIPGDPITSKKFRDIVQGMLIKF